jgi:hypothetical protein
MVCDDEGFSSTEPPWAHDPRSYYNIPSPPDLFDVLRARSDINVAGARARGNNIDIIPDEETSTSTAARAASTSCVRIKFKPNVHYGVLVDVLTCTRSRYCAACGK